MTQDELRQELVKTLMRDDFKIERTGDEEEDLIAGTPLEYFRDLYRGGREFIDLIKEAAIRAINIPKKIKQMTPYWAREFREKMDEQVALNEARGNALLKDYLGIGKTGGMLSEEEKQKAYENYFKPSTDEKNWISVLGIALGMLPTLGMSYGLGKMASTSKAVPEFVPTGIKRAYHPLYEMMRHQNIQKVKGLAEKLAKETDPEMIDFLKSLLRRYK